MRLFHFGVNTHVHRDPCGTVSERSPLCTAHWSLLSSAAQAASFLQAAVFFFCFFFLHPNREWAAAWFCRQSLYFITRLRELTRAPRAAGEQLISLYLLSRFHWQSFQWVWRQISAEHRPGWSNYGAVNLVSEMTDTHVLISSCLSPWGSRGSEPPRNMIYFLFFFSSRSSSSLTAASPFISMDWNRVSCRNVPHPPHKDYTAHLINPGASLTSTLRFK